MLDFTGQIAVVTGASKGIGYFIAKELADAGAHVIAVARSPDGLRKLQNENDGKAKDRFTPRTVDLSNMDAIDALGQIRRKTAGAGLTCLSPMQVNLARPAPSRTWTQRVRTHDLAEFHIDVETYQGIRRITPKIRRCTGSCCDVGSGSWRATLLGRISSFKGRM